MSTRTDDDFWLSEATMDNDICDPRFSLWDCLKNIIPEIEPAVSDLGSILEIGCGYGRLTREVKRYFGNQTIVKGIDINPKFLKKAEEYSGYTTKPSWHSPTDYPYYYCIDNLTGLPSVNAVYTMLVFQHLSNKVKEEYIRQVSLILKKDGIFRFQYVEGYNSSRCNYEAKIEDVRQWCKEAGLTIIKEQFDLMEDKWTWITATK